MSKKEDYVNRLVDYAKKNLMKGYTKESLKWALINQGHSRLEVVKALERVDAELAAEAPVLKTRPQIVYQEEPASAPVKKSLWQRLFG